MACVVLMADPTLALCTGGVGSSYEDHSTSSSSDGGRGPMTGCDAEDETRRAEIVSACRLLEKAAFESAIAAGLMHKLVGILRRYRVHGVVQAAAIAEQQQQLQQQLPLPMEAMPPTNLADGYPPYYPSGAGAGAAPVLFGASGAEQNSGIVAGIGEQFIASSPSSSFSTLLDPQQQPVGGSGMPVEWEYYGDGSGSEVPSDPIIEGMVWENLLGSALAVDDGGWSQLFADLDGLANRF
ncbi:hypothetical protein B0T26DRAFT_710846 [Lasiosphaeria miniovina]|uniref:Uncharacterized protein n=1 Tax=Lasiosphaeria miniovina TaxID=1954250 RepID=A0AA40AKZ1_9PEZI|nr:uncharacterized protein B0T26DRAFT_710846 [Lasiosphaeria miniovina]KAK0717776.1 hypothetical protein B0T26DRAFT_710846 [Lasiosphaeria miniovina]